MSADAGVFFVLAMHHGHCIPANQRLDSAFHLPIARIWELLLDRNRVLVRRIELRRGFDARLTRVARERLQQLTGLAGALFFDNLIESFKPLSNFALISLYRLRAKLLSGLKLSIRLSKK